ncbi:MAG TPA: hypothetical protein VHT03_05950 [Rhizomicrobium sp.]|jgi:POT family proton-dependent oligopeptide transporter|nr:hypothetical protein [Rhizomicrobium sp.]
MAVREAASVASVTRRADAERFAHPKGLYYMAFAEGWERFSFYGMPTLLVLYMGDQLLLPGHVQHVAGPDRRRVAKRNRCCQEL